MEKKISQVGLLLTALFLVSFVPLKTLEYAAAQDAGGETPYGGMRNMTLNCTCTSNNLVYINDYASESTLKLVNDSSSRIYANNNALYAQYLLGTYQKNSGQCEILVAEECVEMTSDGLMGTQPGTGTSRIDDPYTQS
ncbi:MAG: hypothetical protein AAB355_00040 [Patescibacteria group bacterium]